MQILIGRGEYKKVGRPTLQTARDWAVLEKKANNGRKAIMHAIHENRAILVPASIDPAAPAQATKTETKPQKAAKPKPAAKASKVAKKPADDSNAAIAYRMLTSAKGTTRAAMVEACGGWGIDLKGLKLCRDADGAIYGTAKG